MSKAKSLGELGLTARSGNAQTRITAITLDSRQVRPGALFAALPGSRVHGAEFIDPALRMGASAVLTDRAGALLAAGTLTRHPEVALIVAEDARAALAMTAALWFGAQPEVMVAVTGTNGKTSVASFARQLWTALGHAAVNIGTTGVEGAWEAPMTHTTPDSVTLQSLLAQAAAEGITHAAMEASSHGLDQR
ncbi:MAG: UDP-N-acetylmuramoyl-L-alanyl-D-glutamate--2,6-diaminopimelate ligase, partial [Rhodobacteraceae bacterium]|nr:UDP-N-acetylmuramoyl-L-alanyl-D-glutamate--2,6-diaminopimelate ligase [Paracoccaceae bacterium]